MTTIEISSHASTAPRGATIMNGLVAAMRDVIARERTRRSILMVSRFGPHLLRDMGLDPEAVHRALDDGDWTGIDLANPKIKDEE